MSSDLIIDQDERIIQRVITGELNANRALKIINRISIAAKLYQGYSILIDIRDTTFQPQMSDLLEIATECSKRLTNFSCKIAFLIPDTDERKRVAKLFRTCMDAQGFKLRQFFEYDDAIGWLSS